MDCITDTALGHLSKMVTKQMASRVKDTMLSKQDLLVKTVGKGIMNL